MPTGRKSLAPTSRCNQSSDQSIVGQVFTSESATRASTQTIKSLIAVPISECPDRAW